MESALRRRPEPIPSGFTLGIKNSGFFSLCTIAPSPQRKLSSRYLMGGGGTQAFRSGPWVSRTRGKLTRKGKKKKKTKQQQQQQQNEGPLVLPAYDQLVSHHLNAALDYIWTPGIGSTQLFFLFFVKERFAPFISPIRPDFTCHRQQNLIVESFCHRKKMASFCRHGPSSKWNLKLFKFPPNPRPPAPNPRPGLID